MVIEIKIPTPGESITEVEIATWLVKDGDYVQKDQELAEIESDKATLPLLAEKAGKIKILAEMAIPIAVGSVACTIDTAAEVPAGIVAEDKPEDTTVVGTPKESSAKEVVGNKEPDSKKTEPAKASADSRIKSTPLAKKLMEENKLSVDDIVKGLKKITTNEVRQVIDHVPAEVLNKKISREVSRERMSSLRRKISERLVAVKNETAMLTTFNEIDMSAIMKLRKKHQGAFVDQHGIKLGFMSFFTKAATIALNHFPKINSYIDGEEIVSPDYNDVGIAVQTDKGLMVPVLRNVEALSLADIELQIAELAKRARIFKLAPDEMSGGTFTITNGGVFGSLLSTPILNPPQSGILGMHNIVERPIALNGEVVIRPMMYVALSYDHRIVDGRESVSFLVKIKELLESPHKILFETQDPDKTLLGI